MIIDVLITLVNITIYLPEGKSELAEGVIAPWGDSAEETDGESTGEPTGEVELVGDVCPLPPKFIQRE